MENYNIVHIHDLIEKIVKNVSYMCLRPLASYAVIVKNNTISGGHSLVLRLLFVGI
jgi:hypothetical protein